MLLTDEELLKRSERVDLKHGEAQMVIPVENLTSDEFAALIKREVAELQKRRDVTQKEGG